MLPDKSLESVGDYQPEVMMGIDWKTLNESLPHPTDILPHRDPLLLLKSVYEISEDRVIGEMCLKDDAPVFAGHFPGDPTLPGVYLIEGMAQALAYHQRILFPDQNVLLASIKSAKFRSVVRPGDVIELNVQVVKSKLKFVEGVGLAKVRGEVVGEVHCLGVRVDS